VSGFNEPLQAQADEWQRRVISAQIRSDVAFAAAMAQAAFTEVMTDLPADIVELNRTVSFPRFRVHAWKNEWPRRRETRTLSLPSGHHTDLLCFAENTLEFIDNGT